jgi:hypothetical protein
MHLLRRTALLAAVMAAPFAVSSAQAASNTVPLARTHSIVVDTANNQVFISGARDDTSQSSLFVMNADGTFKQTIAGETDAAGLVLDGSSLYVGRCAAGPDSTHGIVDVIDTNTLTVTESIPIALTPNADVGPCNLAIAGGRLWYSPGDQWQHLAAVDLAAPHTQHTYDVGPLIYGEQFATSQTDPNLLMVADQGLSGTEVYKFDVSADTPVLAKNLSMFDEGEVGGMAITPDGATFVAAANDAVWRYDVATLTKQGSYSTTTGPRGVAISPDGKYLAAPDGTAVRVYDTSTGTLIGSVNVSPQTIQFGLVGFSQDGMRMYVPTWTSFYSSPTTVRVLTNPIVPASSLTLKTSAGVVRYHGRVKITVHLGGTHTNRSVRIYKTPYGGSRTLLATVTVGASGSATVTSPALSRRTTFQAEYDGDATSAATTSANVGVKVRALISVSQSNYYAVSHGYHLYHYRAGCWSGSAPCPALLGRIRPATGGVAMTFVMQRHTSSGWVTAVKGPATTNAKGYAKAIFRYRGSAFIGLSMRAHVTWGGNKANLGGKSAWSYVRITS